MWSFYQTPVSTERSHRRRSSPRQVHASGGRNALSDLSTLAERWSPTACGMAAPALGQSLHVQGIQGFCQQMDIEELPLIFSDLLPFGEIFSYTKLCDCIYLLASRDLPASTAR